ncbi:MAG: transglycosylase domain-containing protein [Spirochaetales bacterium]|nr:transglycosylase domain-containing protein [Spirochaetales bacterium]
MISRPVACSRLLYPAPWLLVFLGFLLVLFCPGQDLRRFRQQQYSPVLTDRHGTVLQVVPLDDGLRREYSGFDDIPPPVRSVFLYSEDKYFMAHRGVDLFAVARALFLNSGQNRIISGASTITMQLARLLNPHAGGYGGKLGEMLTAVRYEANFSKKRIFAGWISSLPYGRNIEGLACAARMYFDCTPAELSVPQAALLSIIPRSPERYSPDADSGELNERMKDLLMLAGHPVSDDLIERTIENAGKKSSEFCWPLTAEHFCNRVVTRLALRGNRGGVVRTTLDYDLQEDIEYILREKVYSATDFRISNAAALVLDPESRQVLAWVGSVNYFSRETLGMNDGVLARTQPGSTLKPFLYELALENGFTAATLLPDIPMQFGRGELYLPMNFNNRYNGPVRLRVALASSLNIPAVYTLDTIGIDRFIKRLRQLGFDSLDREDAYYGLGMALGGVDISLYELVNAYCAFADEGRYAAPVFFAGSSEPEKTKVMDVLCASLIQDILSDPVGRVTGFGHFGTAARIKKAMIKTGTSNQFNNIWAVGVTPEYSVGVWMGNFTGDTVIGKPGSSLPAQAVADFLSHRDLEEEFAIAPELRRYEICPLSGKLRGKCCPDGIMEYFLPGKVPAECDFHQPNGIVYPAEYAAWIEMAALPAATAKAGQRGVRILSPIEDARFFLDPWLSPADQQIAVEVIAGSDAGIILFCDGRELARGTHYLRVMLPLEKGRHLLEAVCADDGDAVGFTVH